MKVSSGHVIFKKKFEWKHLENVFPEILKAYFNFAKIEDENTYKIVLYLNLLDIRKNRKPCGYTREARIRMVIPLQSKLHPSPEIYFYRNTPSEEVYLLTNEVSRILKESQIDHSIKWNNLILLEIRKKK